MCLEQIKHRCFSQEGCPQLIQVFWNPNQKLLALPTAYRGGFEVFVHKTQAWAGVVVSFLIVIPLVRLGPRVFLDGFLRKLHASQLCYLSPPTFLPSAECLLSCTPPGGYYILGSFAETPHYFSHSPFLILFRGVRSRGFLVSQVPKKRTFVFQAVESNLYLVQTDAPFFSIHPFFFYSFRLNESVFLALKFFFFRLYSPVSYSPRLFPVFVSGGGCLPF